MKKNATLFLLLMMLLCTVSPVLASSTNPSTTTATTEPGPDALKSALSEFKSISRSERRSRIKEAKKAIKEYKARKRAGLRDSDTDTDTILLVILAILLPPLAVYLHEGELNGKFWISLILSLLVILLWPLWLIAIAYALLVVLDAI